MRRRPPSRSSVLPERPMRRARSSIEIQKFAEDDDEDFSDVNFPKLLGSCQSLLDNEESERESEDGGLMLMSKMSSNSWLADDEEEFDPFASMDPGWDEMDLEANIARDRHARLAEKVEDLVSSLKTTEGDELLAELAEELVSEDIAAHVSVSGLRGLDASNFPPPNPPSLQLLTFTGTAAVRVILTDSPLSSWACCVRTAKSRI